ncbi:MAG: hypothetical protein JWM31_1285 [Solirubrobacterales bacterium]|nr:hypothetical protein [Solirubrobacterales bacterium]
MRAEGLSLRSIADLLGVSQSSVSLWVRDIARQAPPTAAVPDSRSPDAAPSPVADSSTKRCPRCERTQAVEHFNRSGAGRCAWCRSCYRDYHRGRRPERQAVRARQLARGRAHVSEVLAGAACADCGTRDTVVMEFDHLDGKVESVARLLGGGANPARLDAEIARCEIVCVNCHRRRTATRGGHRRGAERWWETTPPAGRARARNVAIAYSRLETSGCTDCGTHALCVLEFDHVGGKTANVSTLAWEGCSEARLHEEMALCAVRCANCHRRRTAVAGGHYRATGRPS